MPTRSIRHRRSGNQRTRRSRLPSAAAAAFAVAGLVFAACGGTPNAGDKRSASSRANDPTTTTTTAPPITTPTVDIGGTQVTVPTDDGSPITPLQDSGQNVIVTTKGFLPRVLYSDHGTPVVYTNLSTHAVTVSFPHSPASPPATIAPGSSYAFTPRSMQYEYRSSTGDTGYVVVGAFTS
jgi:hypothetical protein